MSEERAAAAAAVAAPQERRGSTSAPERLWSCSPVSRELPESAEAPALVTDAVDGEDSALDGGWPQGGAEDGAPPQ